MTSMIVAMETVANTIDIFTKLRNSFRLSAETRNKSLQCQNEIKKITFKKFDEKYSCKRLKEIQIEEFETFVLERLQKRLGLPDNVKDSLLDGIHADENEEKVNQFQYKDGEGKIHHGRFITVKRNGKIDVAYAIYTLSFELPEKEIEHEGSFDWWFGLLPVWNVPHTTKKIQNLSESQKKVFSEWCEVKLYDCVALECSKEY